MPEEQPVNQPTSELTPLGFTMYGQPVGVNQQGTIQLIPNQPNANGRQYTQEAVQRISDQLQSGLGNFIGQPISPQTVELVRRQIEGVRPVISVDSIAVDPADRNRLNVDMTVRPSLTTYDVDLRQLIVGTQPMTDRAVTEAKRLEPSAYEQPKCEYCGRRGCTGSCRVVAATNPCREVSLGVDLGADIGADSTHIYRRSSDGGLERLPQMAAQQRERIRDEQLYGGMYQQIRFETEGVLARPADSIGRMSEEDRLLLNHDAMVRANMAAGSNVEESEAVASLRRAAERISTDPELSRAFIGTVHQYDVEGPNPNFPIP